jgi:glyoxylase-like metal-dependent hydrolase (beta-lactamase superfamily II)
MMKKLTAALLGTALLTMPVLAQQETSRWTALAERDWADLPTAAQDTPIPQDSGFLSREVKPGVFVVTEGLYQAMFVVTRTGVVVVDAPPTIGPRLLQAIKAATNLPVTHFIYSHSHIDHVGAAVQFGNVVRIASRETAAKLDRYRDPNRPLATQILPGASNRLTIGGVVFQLDEHGNQHEPGNLYIHLPAQRVLMVVDIVFPGWVPFTNLGMAEDVQGFIEAHDTVMSYDFDVIVGGHLSRPGTRADVEVQREYVRDLVASAQAAQREVQFGDVATEIGFANRWLLVKTYMDRVADHCAASMMQRWPQRLGGAAVSTPGHCWVMQEHLNINGVPTER